MLSISRNQSLAAAALAYSALIAIAACSPNVTDGQNMDICQTAVDGATSPSTGFLTLDGQFYANESVILQYTDANHMQHQVSGTPQTDRNVFTLGGLPSGVNTYTIIISCSAGQENNGSHNYTVK
ncbi:MAG: hypothetical protein ABJB66_09630 [Gemmatimonadaceae bacterium]